jgi:hypothetical protein
MNVQSWKWYERYAWILLFVMGLLLVLLGVSYIVIALPERSGSELALREGRVYTAALLEQAPPQLALVVGVSERSGGIFEAGFGLFVLAVTWSRFRQGDRWAWWVLWLLPAALLAECLNVARAGAILGPLPVFVVVPVLGLVLPIRRFFGSRSIGSGATDSGRVAPAAESNVL